jgi:uncharacterized protein YhaN
MPGFATKGFELKDLSDGLNLIVGPNASGKTTSCRAIRGLLWPETLSGLAPVSLVGRWLENESRITIELEGDRRNCQIDGQSSEAPPVPGPHLAECFTITVGSLIQATEGDAKLAGSVLREMAGGYDVEAVMQQFSISRRCGQANLKARKAAMQEVRRIQQEQKSLLEEESELGNLEQEVAESRQAQALLARLTDVRQLLDARTLITETARSLENFPSDMDRLNGGEAAALEQLNADLEDEVNRLEEAQRVAKEAQSEKDGTALPAEGIPQTLLKEQQVRLDGLRDAEQLIDRISSEIVLAQSQMTQSLGRLGEDADSSQLDAIDLTGLDSAEAFHRDAEQLRARQTAVEEKLAALGDEQPPGETDTLAEAIGIIRQWFESPTAARPPSGPDRITAWALTASLMVIGVSLGVLVSPWALIATAAGGVGALMLLVTRVSLNQDAGKALQQRYQRLNIEPPEVWDAVTVGKHLNQLEQRLAKARSLDQLQLDRRKLQAALDRLKPEFEAIDLRRRSLVECLGVALSTSDLTLVVFAQDLLRYRQARDTLLGLQEQIEQSKRRRSEQLSGVNEHLTQFGQDSCDDYQVGRVRSEAVAQQAEQFRDADARLITANREILGAKARVDDLSGRKTTFFENLGLSEDDESALGERLRRLPEYRELQSNLTTRRGQETAALDRLSDAPDLQELNRTEVDAEASRLESFAGRHEGLVDRIAATRVKVDKARRESELQDALSDLDQTTNKLAQSREDATLAAAGTFLLGLVQDEQQDEHQPAVFRQAREWLTAFTRGRYDLQIASGDNSGPVFRAYDNTQQRGLELKELSGGTRMQLLLAVRLAFAASAERGVQLPFVLDEALSGTDPTRFRAIIECLTALIREGRQVFYFTCQPGDAEAWRQVTEEQGFHGAKLFDLAKVRDLQQPEGALLAASAAAREAVPAPEGRTLSEYMSSLGVPAFDPALGVAGLQVGFLLDDPEHLHGLLRAGVRLYGQLKSLLDQGRAEAYLPSAAAQKTAARAVVVQAVCDAWKVGRGRPVNREVLSVAGVTDAFIDRVTDIARDLDWDASRLVAALEAREDERARGFRASTLESVLEVFTADGYLDPRQLLTEPEALTRVLSAANDTVLEGNIGVDEVRGIFEHFWALGNPSASA